MIRAALSALAAFGAALARRLEPFLDLLDARYLPLLFAVAPQAWTVYAWLLEGGAPEWVAIMGGLGYEFVYVGAIAWAARGAGWSAARLPAVTALIFSVAVAVAHYGPSQGALAVLHAGFPLVAYAYTVMMHAPAGPARPGLWSALVRRWFKLDQPADQAPAPADQPVQIAVVQTPGRQLEAPPVDQELVQVGRRVVTLRGLADSLSMSKTTLSRKLDQLTEEADHGRPE